MKVHRLIQAALAAGATLMMAASASAAPITYMTSGAGTHFNPGTSLSLTSDGGVASATLTFLPNDGVTGTPSFVNYGIFRLTCAACSTTVDATFSAFSFSLEIIDVTDGGSGTFTGTSSGGSVFSDASTIVIHWSPVALPPFGPTTFSLPAGISFIVAPNSGSPAGETTVQGFVTSSEVPEPGTLGLVGAAMVGLCLLKRKPKTH